MKTLKTIFLGLCILAATACTGQFGKPDLDNDVIENIMSRRSIRQYKPEQVEKKVLRRILECGVHAPNGMNRQSWEVRVVEDTVIMKKLIKFMAEANPETDASAIKACFQGAPTMIFVANDPSYDFSVIDCGLLSENIMLSAWSLGVGSVCLGSPIRYLRNSPEAIELLSFSPGYTPAICIGLGYPDEEPEAKPRDYDKVRFVEDMSTKKKKINLAR